MIDIIEQADGKSKTHRGEKGRSIQPSTVIIIIEGRVVFDN